MADPIPVTVAQIVTGHDTDMPSVTLNWRQSVTYQLGPAARALFKYKPLPEAITLVANGRSVLADVDLTRDDTTLTLTIKPNTGPWTAKATLFFLALLDQPAAPGGVDPTVTNTGVPS
ncbi:MAG: hypothetical protein NVS9B10_13540 [Nevskia sp.]